MAEPEKKFEIIRWLIERNDDRRSGIANRAAISLSADAVVLTGIALLLDKTLSNLSLFVPIERIILASAIGATLVLLAFSVYFSTMAIANVWKTNRAILKNEPFSREFFYQRETLEKSSSFQVFKKRFDETKIETIKDYALGELWSVVNTTYKRYQTLRLSIRFTVLSLVTLFFALLIFIFKVLQM
jgi:hypothetical protein